MLHHFSFVLDAYSAGFSKPSPLIFAKAVQLANLEQHKKSEFLHIGDDLKKDYLGARGAGWKSFLVTPDYIELCHKHSVTPDTECMFGSLISASYFLNSLPPKK